MLGATKSRRNKLYYNILYKGTFKVSFDHVLHLMIIDLNI